MPRRPKIDKTGTIEATKGEIVDESGIPTPQAQADILHPESEFHVIHLLDGTEIELRKAITVADILAKRIEGKMFAITTMIRAEGIRLAPVIPTDAERLSVILASSDPIFHAIVNLIATLTGQPEVRILGNIRTEEVIAAFGVIMKVLQALSPKAQAPETTTK
jgi:hypothetical protein